MKKIIITCIFISISILFLFGLCLGSMRTLWNINHTNTSRHTTTTVVAEPNFTDIVSQSTESVVAVYCLEYPNFPASGFYIGDGIIITAGHVAKTEGLTKVVFKDGSEHDILDQIVCPDYDCGILIIKNIQQPALKFDDDTLQIGQPLFIIGNPAECTFLVTKGILSGFTECGGYFGDTMLLAYDVTATNGSSGSPVMDNEGEVVAVHVGSKANICVGIGKDDILNFLQSAKLGK